jgi:hypothetical protein
VLLRKPAPLIGGTNQEADVSERSLLSIFDCETVNVPASSSDRAIAAAGLLVAASESGMALIIWLPQYGFATPRQNAERRSRGNTTKAPRSPGALPRFNSLDRRFQNSNHMERVCPPELKAPTDWFHGIDRLVSQAATLVGLTSSSLLELAIGIDRGFIAANKRQGC